MCVRTASGSDRIVKGLRSSKQPVATARGSDTRLAEPASAVKSANRLHFVGNK